MFSKKQRIEREKIGNIMKNPDFLLNSKNISIKGVKGELSYPRFSIIISKKLENSAVKRHFLKRKIFNFINDFKLKSSVDLVFYIKNKEIINNKEEFDSLLKKCIID